jgi:hypothetical protein
MEVGSQVWLLHSAAISYHVAESVEEVTKRWLHASQAYHDDQAAVVELTVVTGYFNPYPLAVNPHVVSHIEATPPLMAQWSQDKTRERWDRARKDLESGTTGFGGESA